MSTLNAVILITISLSTSFMRSGLMSPAQRSQEPLWKNQDLLRIEMTPIELLSNPDEKPYRVGGKVRLKVIAKNDSDQRIMVRVADIYYQNRPRLYKNDQLVPYRSQITKLVRSKDTSPEFAGRIDFIFVEPYSSADFEELDLNDWYGPLEPGSYRLINRYRFKIYGPWSADSAPVLFRVVKQ